MPLTEPSAHAQSLPGTQPTKASDATSFAALIKASSAKAHSRAERSRFITELMQGKLDPHAYHLLLAQYLPIYSALEAEVAVWRERSHQLLVPFLHPGLDRTARITHDLHTLAGHLGVTEEPLVASMARAYAQRIREVSTSPARLLAHHYLRYLGDLSGGQAIAALVARHYGIPHEALTMYRFDEIAKPKVFKDQYRALLDAAPFMEANKEELLAEVQEGFALNAQLFAELDERLGLSTLRN